MKKNVVFYAYHGTNEESARKIVNQENFHVSPTRDDHWLGRGAYSFREDEEQALLWSKNRIKAKGEFDQIPSVVEICVDVRDENFLNLDSRSGLKKLAKHVDNIAQELKESEYYFPEKGTSKMICFVLTLLSDEIYAIQRTFDVPSKLDSNKSLDLLAFEHNKFMHKFNLRATQICIRNNKGIKELGKNKIIREDGIRFYIKALTNKKSSVRKELLEDELFDWNRKNKASC